MDPVDSPGGRGGILGEEEDVREIGMDVSGVFPSSLYSSSSGVETVVTKLGRGCEVRRNCCCTLGGSGRTPVVSVLEEGVVVEWIEPE
jgi:hypothetical protein